MAEGSYAKLTEQRATLQDITPGELNQPIDVARLNARRCVECGQTLPPTYEPPADEDWSTGIFGCAEDTDTCWKGLLIPCVLFGRNVESTNTDFSQQAACAGHVICVEGGLSLAALTAAFNGVIDPQTSFLICEGLFFAWWMCGIYTSMARQSLQRKYHLKDSPCDPCMVHCCFHWCALCQEAREIKGRLSDTIGSSSTTLVSPPPVQEMNAIDQNKASSSSSANDTGLEIQPL